MALQMKTSSVWTIDLKLASFKADQRPYCSSAANHVDAAVLAHVARTKQVGEKRWKFQNPVKVAHKAVILIFLSLWLTRVLIQFCLIYFVK